MRTDGPSSRALERAARLNNSQTPLIGWMDEDDDKFLVLILSIRRLSRMRTAESGSLFLHIIIRLWRGAII